MRVAILEPNPRVCGPCISIGHLAAGLKLIGHDVDFVAFSKSGRMKKHWGAHEELPLGCGWSTEKPDVVAKYADAVSVLDTYDRIILTEPKCASLDKEAMREGWEMPVYAEWLIKTKTPWTTALHGAQYSSGQAPFLARLFASDSWVGAGVTYGMWVDFVESDETGVLKVWDWIPSDLPFRLPESPTQLNRGRGAAGTVGRMAPNKGQQMLAWLPLYADVDAEIWGACSKGLGPSYSYLIWEELGKTDGAKQIFRDGVRGPDGKMKHTPLNPFPWEARVNGHSVHYRGNYYDDRPFATFDIAVNLTSPRFSSGLTEFATLEAIAAGKRLVTNRNVSADGLHAAVVDIVPPSPQHMAAEKPAAVETLVQLGNAVTDAQDFTHRHLAENFDYVLRNNNPAIVADQFMRCFD